MDNKYEQEFMQNVRREAAQDRITIPPKASQSGDSSKLPLAIAIILAIIVLFESIALVILLIHVVNGSTSSFQEDAFYESFDDTPPSLEYDSNYQIVSFALTCTSTDGNKYVFTKDKTYEQLNQSSNPTGSGIYKILNSSAVVLNDGNNTSKTVYYDGLNIIDGTTFYECEESL